MKTWVVLMNTSDSAVRGFWLANHLLEVEDKKRHDKIYMTYVYDKSIEKDADVPTTAKKNYVSKFLHDLAFNAEQHALDAGRHTNVSFDVETVSRRHREKPHQAACAYCDDVGADYVVIGSGKHTRLDSLGSVAYNVMKGLNTNETMPTLIIYKSQYQPERLALLDSHERKHRFRFLVCSLGDNAGDCAFKAVRRFAKGSYFVLYCAARFLNEEKGASVKKHLERQLEEAGVEGEVVLREGRAGDHAGPTLLAACDQYSCDFVVLGTERKGKEVLGSMTKYVAQRAQVHVIVAYSQDE